MKRRSIGITLLSVASSTALSAVSGPSAWAAPASQAGGEAVRAAIAAHDYRRAAITLDALVTERLPATDRSGPDPLLDRLFAELIDVNGTPSNSTALLVRLTSDPKLEQRSHYQRLLATAREDQGEFAEAERLYDLVRNGADTSPQDRVDATIGYARLHMMTNADEALAALKQAKPLPQQSWEVELQRARAERLAGRSAAADTALARAWNDAPAAGADQGAAARIAADLAVAAGQAHDRSRLIALLAIDRFNRAANQGQELVSADLPICGSSGITPDDQVAVAFLHHAPPARPIFSLIWASRPAAASAFLTAVARNHGLQVPDGQAAALMLTCRSAPSSEYRGEADAGHDIVDWSTGRGAYPLVRAGDEVDAASLASLLADREHRYGSGSVMLLPILQRLLPLTIAGASDQEARARAAALAHRINGILSANAGPADLVLLTSLFAAGLDMAAQSKSATTTQTEFQTLLGQAAKNPAVSLDALYTIVSAVSGPSQIPAAIRTQVVEQTLSVLRARVKDDDPRVLALGLRLVSITRDQGDAVAVRALVRRFGFAPDLCDVAVPATRFTSSNITPDDYPADMIQTTMQGRTTLEFSIGPTGMAAHPRILIADPPFAFDAVALAKSSTLTYEPIRAAGAPASCRAQVQSVRWQMPY